MTDAGPVFALVTGGGTGGHVYPALALAQELVGRGRPRGAIRFVGARRGLEASAVPDAGFAIDLLPGRGLKRRFSPAAVFANFRALAEAVVAFVRAWHIVGRYRPAVVVGTGGYASVACVVAARLRRVPVVVHEQNAVPGLANRIAVRLGARAAVSLPATPLRGAIVTGNPVRAEIARLERSPDTDPPMVAFVGGSLGARTINGAALDLFERWRDRADVRVHHVAGTRDEPVCAGVLAAQRRSEDALRYDLVGYEDDMPSLYRRASVVVGRSGAVTVAELAAAGVPAVLVPLPGAPRDHQTANARALEAAGGAVVVPDSECDAAHLDPLLSELLADAARLERMSDGARTLGRPEAAARLADLVEGVAGGAR